MTKPSAITRKPISLMTLRHTASWITVILIMGQDCSAAPIVRVTPLKGDVRIGQIQRLTSTDLELVGEPPVRIPTASIVRLDWPDAKRASVPEAAQTLLANGDRIGIRPQFVNEETLQGSWEHFPAWPTLDIPLEAVRGVLLLPPRNPLDRSRALVRILEQQIKQDVFFLSNGDQILGQLLGFDGQTFQLETTTGKVTLPINSVRGFGMNPELTSFPPLKSTAAIASLVDGSLLTVTDVRMDHPGLMACQTAFGTPLQIPEDVLYSVQFLSHAITYVSDMEPEEYRSQPYLAHEWPLRRNANALGGPLLLGHRDYARGLGMHSQSEVTYHVGKEYDSFQALIGIDGVTAGKGSVIFRVLGDGKPLFTSDIVRGKTPPTKVGPLDVSQVERLTLVVDYADQGDLLDHANWCDAVLLRAP